MLHTVHVLSQGDWFLLQQVLLICMKCKAVPAAVNEHTAVNNTYFQRIAKFYQERLLTSRDPASRMPALRVWTFIAAAGKSLIAAWHKQKVSGLLWNMQQSYLAGVCRPVM